MGKLSAKCYPTVTLIRVTIFLDVNTIGFLEGKKTILYYDTYKYKRRYQSERGNYYSLI